MKRLVQRILFAPPWWAFAINPHFLPRRALYAAIAATTGSLRGRVLDVGCGAQPYRHLLDATTAYVGLEIDTTVNRVRGLADHYYDGLHMPYDDGEFDGVLCNQVLEHVFDAEIFVAEMARVLRPGGCLLLTVPFVWPEHEQPYDARRYTSFGLLALLEPYFRVERYEKLTGGTAALAALLADRINYALHPLPLPLRIGGRLICVAPVNLLGWLCGMRAGCDSGFFLDNFVIASRLEKSRAFRHDAGIVAGGGLCS